MSDRTNTLSSTAAFAPKALAAAAVAASLTVLGGVPAAANDGVATQSTQDKGLYGSQDPTYDGVYRQGLAIAGLAAVDQKVPGAGVRWLLRQQCDDGSFEAYRAAPNTDCSRPDLVNFTGPDTNSTALAAMALFAVGKDQQAKAAVRWLRKKQNSDGGFPYIAGGDSDANSTGVSLSAIRAAKNTAGNRQALKSGAKYLRTVQLRCSAKPAVRGMLAYQASPKTANDLATAQGALGLLSTLPMQPAEVSDAGGPIRCSKGKAKGKSDLTTSTLAALQRRLHTAGGLLPSSTGSGSDPSATAQAVLAMAAADVYPKDVRKAVKRLQRTASSYAVANGDTVPGAAGTLLLVAGAVEANPKSFGGVNLVQRLAKSQQ